MKRILPLALIAALVVAAPADAKKPRKHKSKTKVTAVQGNPKPTIEVAHPWDAGGFGADLYGGANVPAKVNLFDPLEVATGLGNQALGQLGLPPLPTL